MTAQNFVPRRDDAILKSYEMYKQAFENCGDPASFGHSLSILDEFVAQEAGREEPRVRCTALDFRVQEDGSRPAFRETESTGPAGVEGFLSGLASAPRAAVGSDSLDEASFLIVENLCPETVVKLGLTLRIPPQFWSEYVENRPLVLEAAGRAPVVDAAIRPGRAGLHQDPMGCAPAVPMETGGRSQGGGRCFGRGRCATVGKDGP
jgi:hypothetical protein